MLTNEEEVELVEGLHFAEHDEWVKKLYRCKCKKVSQCVGRGGGCQGLPAFLRPCPPGLGCPSTVSPFNVTQIIQCITKHSRSHKAFKVTQSIVTLSPLLAHCPLVISGWLMIH